MDIHYHDPDGTVHVSQHPVITPEELREAIRVTELDRHTAIEELEHAQGTVRGLDTMLARMYAQLRAQNPPLVSIGQGDGRRDYFG